ncbi:hypothetical protein [Aquipuribacter nitratireducens]|uniref:Flagellar biosynthesis protein FlhF n=1 Tax=Aquipuribacter nitratireducens TaxID=650104 RepID=A0ABW0GNG9_9MICO
MPRQLRLEGPALEPLLEQARREHGADVAVVDAQRVRTGGIGGFFAREHYEVTVSVADPVARPVVGPVAGPVDGPVDGPVADPVARPVVGPVAGAVDGSIGALLAAADGGDVASVAGPAPAPVPAPRPPARPLSTESPAFDDVLAALRADLLGVPEDAVTALPVTAAALAGARTWAPTAVLDVEGGAAPDTEPAPTTAPVSEPASGPVGSTTPSGVVLEPRRQVPAQPVPPAADDRQVGQEIDRKIDREIDREIGRRIDEEIDPVAHLAALAVAVGAPSRLARLAAEDVVASGCTTAHLRLPLLAAALGSRLAADTVPLSAAAGELVVVTGPAAHVVTTAAAVAARLGRARTARWDDSTTGSRARRRTGVATPADLPTEAVADVHEVAGLRERARAAGAALVLHVVDADAGLLDVLAPDLVVAVVDASRAVRPAEREPLAPTTAVVPDVVALVGAATAIAPATPRPAPLTLLDDRHATEGAWTGVLLDALRWVDGT